MAFKTFQCLRSASSKVIASKKLFRCSSSGARGNVLSTEPVGLTQMKLIIMRDDEG